MAVFSAPILLADKQLVNRRQTSIQLHVLYTVSIFLFRRVHGMVLR